MGNFSISGQAPQPPVKPLLPQPRDFSGLSSDTNGVSRFGGADTLTLSRPGLSSQPTTATNSGSQPIPPWAAGLDLAHLKTSIPNVTLRDLHGNVIFQGTVDLTATLDRIKSGGHYPHNNDGSVFQNRPLPGHNAPALPAMPAGYYHEYVNPTPQEAGPGPQRIIIGLKDEVYYTSDHYNSFIQLNQ